MGYIKNHAIIVTGWGKSTNTAHKKALKIFGNLVSNKIMGITNGDTSFFIAPDGSKEGWETSDMYDNKRHEFIQWCKERKEVEYVELFYGEDNGNAEILNHS